MARTACRYVLRITTDEDVIRLDGGWAHFPKMVQGGARQCGGFFCESQVHREEETAETAEMGAALDPTVAAAGLEAEADRRQ